MGVGPHNFVGEGAQQRLVAEQTVFRKIADDEFHRRRFNGSLQAHRMHEAFAPGGTFGG